MLVGRERRGGFLGFEKRSRDGRSRSNRRAGIGIELVRRLGGHPTFQHAAQFDAGPFNRWQRRKRRAGIGGRGGGSGRWRSLRDGRIDGAREVPRWQALLWLVQQAGSAAGLPQFDRWPLTAETTAFSRAAELSDEVARRASAGWTAAQTKAALARLAATKDNFLSAGVSSLVLACRAERLVLALDRLLAAQPAGERPPAASARLDELFHLVQSQPDFEPARFAQALAVFAQTLDR